MSRRGLGVSVMPLDNRSDALVATAVTADRIGYDAFFLPETWALDVPVVLAAAAVRTERIVLGTGILGVWGRSAAQLAMAAGTLASVSGGRFVLGLGVSTAQLTEGLHDVRFRAPIPRMRRTMVQVRALLRGERLPLATVDGARPLKLNLRERAPVPIFLAALADESVRLAGELADGWLPFLYPRRHLAAGLALLREGAARSGAGGIPSICPSIPTVVEADAETARRGAAWFVAFYVTTMGRLYRESLVRHGFDKEVGAVLEANTPRFTGEVPVEAEALLEELTVYGTPDAARARLECWYAAGAALPILLLRPDLGREEMERTLQAFAPVLGPRGSKDGGLAQTLACRTDVASEP